MPEDCIKTRSLRVNIFNLFHFVCFFFSLMCRFGVIEIKNEEKKTSTQLWYGFFCSQIKRNHKNYTVFYKHLLFEPTPCLTNKYNCNLIGKCIMFFFFFAPLKAAQVLLLKFSLLKRIY